MARVIALRVVALTCALTALAPWPASAGGVNIGITIGAPPPPPPPIVIAAPPNLVLVPGTRVYYSPSVSANYFVYGGRHYTFHDGSWFVAATYTGPWTFIAVEQVPPPLLKVPARYYKIPPGHMKKHGGGPPQWRVKGHGPKH
jgi:hypothetical protein